MTDAKKVAVSALELEKVVQVLKAVDGSPGYFEGEVRFWDETGEGYKIALHDHEEGFHTVYLDGEKITE